MKKPDSYVESGVHKGQESDIWKEITNKTGLEVEFITGEFNSLFGYLDSIKADTVGNTITINYYICYDGCEFIKW